MGRVWTYHKNCKFAGNKDSNKRTTNALEGNASQRMWKWLECEPQSQAMSWSMCGCVLHELIGCMLNYKNQNNPEKFRKKKPHPCFLSSKCGSGTNDQGESVFVEAKSESTNEGIRDCDRWQSSYGMNGFSGELLDSTGMGLGLTDWVHDRTL